MSRLYDTLRRMEKEKRRSGIVSPQSDKPVDLLSNVMASPVEISESPRAKINVGQSSRLVALTDPKSLGAEKFRALVARLENLRQKGELESLQITSAVVNEGKTLVAANLAITFVKHFGYKVLLVEGDLHRPSLSGLFGLGKLEGINQWWSSRKDAEEIARYIYNLEEIPLAFLSAGSACNQPSQILQSARFAEMFVRLMGVLTGS